MRILFLADVPLENPGSGSEQVLNHQAVGLARKGMAVCAITRQEAHPSEIVRSINGVCEGTYQASVLDIPRSLLSLARYPRKFYRRFTRDRLFEVAICHQPFNSFSLLVTGKLRNVPLLYVFHSPSHEEYALSHQSENWLTTWPHVAARLMIERLCLKRCAKIVVLSRYMKEKVHDIHGISAHRIVVNPGGVDLDHFKPLEDREVLKGRLGLPRGKIHLLTVRNLEPRMGLDNLLKCMGILKKGQVSAHLTLVGEGIERKNLETLVKECNLHDEVTMAGFMSTELLPQYYGASDFFILPTRHLEGFGLVTPESLACGTPVLGTAVGGTKEILSGFDSRFLFRDTSPEAMAEGIEWAVKRFFVSKKEYDDLRLRCREHASNHYSWERHTDQLKSILDGML